MIFPSDKNSSGYDLKGSVTNLYIEFYLLSPNKNNLYVQFMHALAYFGTSLLGFELDWSCTRCESCGHVW